MSDEQKTEENVTALVSVDENRTEGEQAPVMADGNEGVSVTGLSDVFNGQGNVCIIVKRSGISARR